MKKAKILIAGFFSLILLTGCKSENNANKNTDISSNNTDSTTSTFINQQNNTDNQSSALYETQQTTTTNPQQDSKKQIETTVTLKNQQENNMNNKNSVPSETQQTISANSVQYSQEQTETTSISSLQEQQTNNETTISRSEEIFESELLPETAESTMTDLYPEKITKYTDKYCGKEFIIINVTPQKIYWNELIGYNVTQDQPLEIAIPAIFDEWVSNADGLMIYMNEGNKTFGDLLLNNEKEIKGMTYPQYWSTDYLCPIKNGVVCFGEYTDNIRNTFSRIDDGIYIEEANFYYSELPFENNMSVNSLDVYFETIKNDYDALMQKMIENPDTNYDIAGFWGYQDGVRFRAKINAIY